MRVVSRVSAPAPPRTTTGLQSAHSADSRAARQGVGGVGGLAALFTSYICFENATLNTLNTTLSFKFIVSVTTRCLSEAKAANLSERAKAGRACA